MFKLFKKSERGQAMVEYTVIIAAVALITAVGFQTMGSTVGNKLGVASNILLGKGEALEDKGAGGLTGDEEELPPPPEDPGDIVDGEIYWKVDGTTLHLTNNVEKDDTYSEFTGPHSSADVGGNGYKSYYDVITKVVIDGVIKPENTDEWFANMSKLTTVENLRNIDLGSATSTQSMFAACSSLESIDISVLDFSGILNTSTMFAECSSLKSINMNNVEFSAVKDAHGMFSGTAIETIELMEQFVSSTSLTNMSGMFERCESLTQAVVDLPTGETLDIGGMFNKCENLEYVQLCCYCDVTNWEAKRVFDGVTNELFEWSSTSQELMDKIEADK